MTIFQTKIPAERLLRWLFLVLFWGIWLGMPYLSQDEDERHRRFMIQLIPVTLSNIPLFFLNTELLIPRVLRKRGIAAYLLSVIILVLVFVVIEGFLKSWVLDSYAEKIMRHTRKSFFFVFFITAISTGYGLITHLVSQEKARQQERQERLQSELAFLRSQISPHFIFNILNSIVYLIRSRSPLAEPVTISLSELMRYMLYESADAQVPLEKELDYLKNYVELQKIRFGEDVDVRLHIAGEAGSHIIEPMLMIPFVENAFKHGVGLVASPVIGIELRLEPTALFFTLRNKIAADQPADKDGSSGIGLRNVSRRLELLYPDAHTLAIRKTEEWFIVDLQLQFHQSKK